MFAEAPAVPAAVAGFMPNRYETVISFDGVLAHRLMSAECRLDILLMKSSVVCFCITDFFMGGIHYDQRIGLWCRRQNGPGSSKNNL